MSFFFLFWSTCKFSTSWTIMLFFSPWQKRQGKKIPPPPTGVSPHLRESKIVLDSGFHAVDSGFQVLYSRFLVSGTWIPIVSGFPDFYAQDPWFSTPQFPDFGFHKQNFSDSEIWIPSLTLNTEVKAMTFKLFKSRGSTDQGWGSKTAIKRTPFSELGLYHWLKQ